VTVAVFLVSHFLPALIAICRWQRYCVLILVLNIALFFYVGYTLSVGEGWLMTIPMWFILFAFSFLGESGKTRKLRQQLERMQRSTALLGMPVTVHSAPRGERQ